MSSVEHTIIRNGELFCTHCGGSQAMKMVLLVASFETIANAFNNLHQNCPKTWIEPVAETKGKTEIENSVWWLGHGERGISSETMFKYLSDDIEIPFTSPECHPYDPDDFRRCHLLLQAIPQFKSKLWRLSNLSPAWENLVNNWDKLTEMLEEQMKTKERNGMYEFMQTLIVNKD